MPDSLVFFFALILIVGLVALLSFSRFRPLNDPKTIARLSKKPFGPLLAAQVADRLATGNSMRYSHKDYCGQGLLYRDGCYVIAEFADGEPFAAAVGTWTDKDSFVAFLASQSDFSCSGTDSTSTLFHTTEPHYVNNQRISGKRLQEFASGA